MRVRQCLIIAALLAVVLTFATRSADPTPLLAGGGPIVCDAVSFTSSGVAVPSRICRPSSAASAAPDSRAGVLVLYGCDGPDEFMDLAETLAAAGFVSLYVEYLAPTPEPEPSFCDLSREPANLLPYAPTWLTGLADAATFLGAQPDVDAERLAAAGYSLGGAIALGAGVTTSTFKALAIYSSQLFDLLRGQEGNLPPTILLHGEADTRIPVTESTMLASALAAAGRPYELHTYPGVTHTWREGQRDDADGYTITFLRRYLAPVP